MYATEDIYYSLFAVVFTNYFFVLAQSGGGASSGSGRAPSGGGIPDVSLPEAREVRAGGKRFYFDVLQNDRGVFLKLSEVCKVHCSQEGGPVIRSVLLQFYHTVLNCCAFNTKLILC